MGYPYIMEKKHALIILSILFLLSFPSGSTFAEEKEVSRHGLPDLTPLELKWDQGTETVDTNVISRWVKQKNTLFHSDNYSSEIENINSCPTEESLICDLLLTSRRRADLKLSSYYSIDDSAVETFLMELAKKIDSEPVDAKFKLEEGKVAAFSPEQTGKKLAIDDNIVQIKNALSNNESSAKSVALRIITSEPSVKSSEINNLGIATLIGEGKSNFRGSTKNRIHNIKTATQRFEGVLIKPGEEFSFVQTLGEVDGEHGYQQELVIKKDKTEPEFGGGICQVSTTTFRAAIYSGLKITARKNHAYPVSYYNPQGMDSTIYVPKPDLRFVNNTPGHILIHTQIIGTELTFQFYGTSDGRKVEVDGPKILERNSDGSMKTTFTQRVTDAQGTVLISDVFNSAYDSPDKYPHPVDPSKITSKPKDWSQKQWEYFKKTGLLPTD